jgi:hypothetical protein
MTGLSEGGQPVAVGNGGYIVRSVFPEYWTEDYSGVTGNLRGATRSTSGYVAVGEKGIILYRTLSGPPELLSSGEASGQMGQAFSYSIMSDQSGHELSALRLPDGLELDPETARIHGTPVGHGKNEIVVEAANAFGRSILIVPVNIVGAAPVIVSLPSEIEVHEGDPLHVSVDAYGIENARFRWFYGGDKITDSRFLGVADRILVLDEAMLSDSGEYYVELQNTFGTTVSDPVRITVVLSYDAWADALGLDGDERAIERITREGLPNLIAYALGLLPGGDIRGSAPALRREGDCVVLAFETARWASDARPVIEQSSDLDQWNVVERHAKRAAADPFVEIWTLEICEEAPSGFYRVRFEIE